VKVQVGRRSLIAVIGLTSVVAVALLVQRSGTKVFSAAATPNWRFLLAGLAICAAVQPLRALADELLGLPLRPLVGVVEVLAAVEVVLVKRLLRDLAPATLSVARMGAGVVLLLGWLAVTGRLGALVHLSGRGWLWSIATGVVLAGYVATWFTALSMAPAVDVTAVLAVGAVITALLGYAVKGTALPNAAGLALLTAGAAVVVAARWRSAVVPG